MPSALCGHDSLYFLPARRYTDKTRQHKEVSPMTKRKSAAEEVPFTPTEEPAPRVTETVTPIAPAEGGPRPNERLPEIREMKAIKLGPDRDSPRLRLLRNYRFNQIQIRSDEELPQAAREQLQDAGWKDRTTAGEAWLADGRRRRAPIPRHRQRHSGRQGSAVCWPGTGSRDAVLSAARPRGHSSRVSGGGPNRPPDACGDAHRGFRSCRL
jgi:hypothetical protein